MGSAFLRKMRKTFASVSPITANHIMYYAVMKKRLNLKSPRTFNEKINWLKLKIYPNDDLVVRCTDKIAVRDYIESKNCAHLLNKLYFTWDKAEDINWDELPDKFVLKCNHGCGYNIICTNKSEFDIPAATKQLNAWLKEDFWKVSCEPHYKKINKKILCEEFLENDIIDYKFFCFNGSPEFFYISQNVAGDFHDACMVFLKPNGEYTDFQRTDHNLFDKQPQIPEQIGEMLDIAAKLSEDFPFVRVDLFNVGGKIYFSELTFTPCAGMMPLTPADADEKLGKLIDLSKYQTQQTSSAPKIGVIGRISNELCDGQTIKTRILVNELQSRYPDGEIIVAETYNYKKHPFRLLRQIFRCMRKADVIFILLSRNGIRVISPIVHVLNKLYKKPLLHDCIGGSLDKLVMDYPRVKRYFNSFTINWVETQLLKRNLEATGVENVSVLPNFKPLNCVSENELLSEYNEPYRFCTFSRVIREKGITAAAEAVISINRERNTQAATLDIYGPIEGDYGIELNELINRSDGAIKYMGIADYEDSVNVLKDYYMLLFPTYYMGEGFPGTLIDAFSAGLPVIATDWHCNCEIITHEKTGFIYPTNESHKLRELMEKAMDNPKLIFEMRKNCLKDVQAYSAETVMKTICQKIEEELKR